MRNSERRWAARAARGWPKLRAFAIINGLTGLLIGGLLFYLTHGLLRFQNFPALDVHWVWRVITLFFAVLLPGVLTVMGAYLVLLGATATHRAALIAGQAREVVLSDATDGEPAVTTHRLPESAPPGVKVRSHALHRSSADSRYSRDLLGALVVQSPVALAPLGVGILLLVVATIYYATGYGEAATVILLGVAYLVWKLWRGYRSLRAFQDGAEPDTDYDPTPSDQPITRATPVAPPPEPYDDDGPVHTAQHDYSAPHDPEDRDAYEDTDELPVIERIRDTYSEPKRASASQRRLAERAERERQLAQRREHRRAGTEDTVPETWDVDARRDREERDRIAAQERRRIYSAYEETPQQLRRKRRRDAQDRQPEEAASLFGYARTRWRQRGEGPRDRE